MKKVNMIEVQEWDDLVKKTYKKPYSFQQQNGCMERGTFNLTIPADTEDYEDYEDSGFENGDFGVSLKTWLARNPTEPFDKNEKDQWHIDLVWEREFYPDINMIANDLHARGLIEAGEYVINIDW